MRRTLFHLLGVGAAAALILVAPSARAKGPGIGEVELGRLRIGRCDVTRLTVRYQLDSLMGEPTVSGSYRWEGDAGCKLPTSTVILIPVLSGYNASDGFVAIDPVVPNAGEWAFNVTGSPDWDEVLCQYDGKKKYACVDAANAKRSWKSGLVGSVRVEWDRAAVEAEIAKEERERRAAEEEEARRKAAGEAEANVAAKGVHLTVTKETDEPEKSAEEATPSSGTSTSGGDGTSGGTSSSTSNGTSAGALGSGAAGLGAMGLALGGGGGDPKTPYYQQMFDDEDSWHTASLVAHIGLSVGTMLTIASMAGTSDSTWEHRTAGDVLLGRSSPFRVFSVSFGNGMIYGRFAEGLDTYRSEGGAYIGLTRASGVETDEPLGAPRDPATYIAPFAAMTARVSLLRLDIGAGFSYSTSDVSLGSDELSLRTGVLQFGLGVQVGNGLFSPFASARFQRLSQVDSDSGVALVTERMDLQDRDVEPRFGDWALIVGNTFDFHGLVAAGAGDTTYSPFVEVGVAVFAQDRSFIEPGSLYLTLGMKMQIGTPWSITNDRSRARR